MSTISGISNNWYTLTTNRVTSQNQQTSSIPSSDDAQYEYQPNVNAGQVNQNQGFNGPLETLVANGTITTDQLTAIQDAFRSSMQSNAAGTYGSKPTSPISSLVSSGVITSDQADSIKDAFKNAAKTHKHHHGGHGGAKEMDNKLQGLVSAGTITSDQETAVKNAFQSMMDQNSSSNSNSSTSSNNSFVDPLQSLIDNGTLTQAQENAIRDALMPSNDDDNDQLESSSNAISA